MVIIIADLVILLISVGIGAWSIRKTIKTRIALANEGLRPESTRPLISSHIAWILVAGVVYANLPFNDFINLAIAIAILFGGLNIQEKAVETYLQKKISTIVVKKKPLTKSERKRRNKQFRS